MKILVLGGTHGIGLEVAKQALQAGDEVTVLARHPEEMPIQDAKLHVEKGDVTDPAVVDKTVAENDAVVSAIGIGVTRKPVTVFSQGARNVVESVRKVGRKPIIAVTGIGTGDSRGHGGFLYDRIALPFILRTTYRDKDREEEILKSSGLDWIIVRPAVLTNGPRTGKFRVLTNLEGVRSRKVSRADVAGFILGQLKKPEYLGKTPLLTY